VPINKKELYKLPQKAELLKLIQPKWERPTLHHEVNMGVTLGVIHQKYHNKNKNVKMVDGDFLIDVNNWNSKAHGDTNTKRRYITDRMFENVYYGLDLYLNDFQKAQLLSALNGDSEGSWTNWLRDFRPVLGDKLRDFLVYGLKIIKTKALYRMDKRENKWVDNFLEAVA